MAVEYQFLTLTWPGFKPLRTLKYFKSQRMSAQKTRTIAKNLQVRIILNCEGVTRKYLQSAGFQPPCEADSRF